MAARMSLIVKAESSDQATEYVRERMIPLHFNADWEVHRSSSANHWVVQATCAIDYDPTHLLNEWFNEEPMFATYDNPLPLGTLLSWSKKENGDLISLEFSKSELVGLYIALRDGGGKNQDLIKRVERVMEDNRISWSSE